MNYYIKVGKMYVYDIYEDNYRIEKVEDNNE